MIKNKTVMEVEVNGRAFRFECYPESSLADVSSALDVMRSYITERINASQSVQEEAPKEE